MVDKALGRSDESCSQAAPRGLGTSVTRVVNALAEGIAQIVSPHGLTSIDFALLRLFLEVDEWTTTQLAGKLPLAPSGISRSVGKLSDKGLIKRRRLRKDRRVVMLTLTAEGIALVQDLQQRVREYESSLCAGVSDEEMAVFDCVSSRVTANHAALGLPPIR